MRIVPITLLVFVLSLNVQAAQPLLWSAARKRLDCIDVSGNLVLDVPLGKVVLSDRFFLPLYLTHVVRYDHAGRARSSMECLQLSTFLRPLGPQEFSWRVPGGATVTFAFQPNSDVATKDGFTCRWNRGDEVVIEARTGEVYIFRKGRLSELILTDGTILAVETLGGRIRGITDRATGATLVSVEYDNGLLDKLHLADGRQIKFCYTPSDSPFLRRISSTDGAIACVFDYAEDMLVGVASPRKRLDYSWIFRRRNGRTNPILHTAGSVRYSYEVRDVFVTIRAEYPTGYIDSAKFNMLRD